MYECECGKKYKHKHSILHHSRFLCSLLTPPVLTTTRRSEPVTPPQTDPGAVIDDGIGGVKEGGVATREDGSVLGEGASDCVKEGAIGCDEERPGLEEKVVMEFSLFHTLLVLFPSRSSSVYFVRDHFAQPRQGRIIGRRRNAR